MDSTLIDHEPLDWYNSIWSKMFFLLVTSNGPWYFRWCGSFSIEIACCFHLLRLVKVCYHNLKTMQLSFYACWLWFLWMIPKLKGIQHTIKGNIFNINDMYKSRNEFHFKMFHFIFKLSTKHFTRPYKIYLVLLPFILSSTLLVINYYTYYFSI